MPGTTTGLGLRLVCSGLYFVMRSVAVGRMAFASSWPRWGLRSRTRRFAAAKLFKKSVADGLQSYFARLRLTKQNLDTNSW